MHFAGALRLAGRTIVVRICLFQQTDNNHALLKGTSKTFALHSKRKNRSEDGGKTPAGENRRTLSRRIAQRAFVHVRGAAKEAHSFSLKIADRLLLLKTSSLFRKFRQRIFSVVEFKNGALLFSAYRTL